MSTPVTVLDGESAVRAAVGRELGVTEWFLVTEQRLDDFARATGDEEGAYFAISLSNMFLPQIVAIRGFALGVNYGTQAVELGEPLCAGDRVRGRASLIEVSDVRAGIQTTMVIRVERDRRDGDPSTGPGPGHECLIESLSRWMNPPPTGTGDLT